MATIANQLSIDAYRFNATGNAFVRKETIIIPLPALFTDCAPGPDSMMRVYTKITYTLPGTNYVQEAYVGQTKSQLASLIVNA
jgi:hypothetical protein